METCLCCDLVTAAFVAGLASAVIYGAACALQLWLIVGVTSGTAPIPVFILLFLFFVVFVAAISLCILLVRRRYGACWVWLFPVGILWPLDIALIIYLVVVHYTLATDIGIAEVIFMICRKFIDVLCVLAVAALYVNHRKHRRDQLQQNLLIAESMSYKGSTLEHGSLRLDSASVASRQKSLRERELQNMILTNDSSRPYPSFRLNRDEQRDSFTALDYMRQQQADLSNQQELELHGASTFALTGQVQSESHVHEAADPEMIDLTLAAVANLRSEPEESDSSTSSKGKGKKLPVAEFDGEPAALGTAVVLETTDRSSISSLTSSEGKTGYDFEGHVVDPRLDQPEKEADSDSEVMVIEGGMLQPAVHEKRLELPPPAVSKGLPGVYEKEPSPALSAVQPTAVSPPTIQQMSVPHGTHVTMSIDLGPNPSVTPLRTQSPTVPQSSPVATLDHSPRSPTSEAEDLSVRIPQNSASPSPQHSPSPVFNHPEIERPSPSLSSTPSNDTDTHYNVRGKLAHEPLPLHGKRSITPEDDMGGKEEMLEDPHGVVSLSVVTSPVLGQQIEFYAPDSSLQISEKEEIYESSSLENQKSEFSSTAVSSPERKEAEKYAKPPASIESLPQGQRVLESPERESKADSGLTLSSSHSPAASQGFTSSASSASHKPRSVVRETSHAELASQVALVALKRQARSTSPVNYVRGPREWSAKDYFQPDTKPLTDPRIHRGALP